MCKSVFRATFSGICNPLIFLPIVLATLAGCATTPTTTTGGVEITTTPNDALVEISWQTKSHQPYGGLVSHIPDRVVTPYENADGSFVQYADGQNPVSETTWLFKVQRPGYEPVTATITGHEITGHQHWNLTPAGPTVANTDLPTAVLKLTSAKFNGELADTTPSKDAVKQFNQRTVSLMVHRLLTALSGQPRFRLVTTRMEDVPAGSKILNFDVSIDENEDRHLGEAAAKGFVTGLLTLGLVGYIMPNRYSFSSTLTVVEHAGGKPDEKFEATSKGDSEWDANKPGEFFVASAALKEKIRSANIDKFLADAAARP